VFFAGHRYSDCDRAGEFDDYGEQWRKQHFGERFGYCAVSLPISVGARPCVFLGTEF